MYFYHGVTLFPPRRLLLDILSGFIAFTTWCCIVMELRMLVREGNSKLGVSDCDLDMIKSHTNFQNIFYSSLISCLKNFHLFKLAYLHAALSGAECDIFLRGKNENPSKP